MKPGLKLISWLLTLCGISLTCTACYAPPNVTEFHDMPHFEGIVVSEDTGLPVENIRVAVELEESGFVLMETTTDGSGRYSLNEGHTHSIDFPLTSVNVVAEDTDGPGNGGEFATAVKNISIEGKGQEESIGVDFNLKPKLK